MALQQNSLEAMVLHLTQDEPLPRFDSPASHLASHEAIAPCFSHTTQPLATQKGHGQQEAPSRWLKKKKGIEFWANCLAVLPI